MPITRTPYFSPTQIGGCQLWLDAADTSTSSMTINANVVTAWNDKSGSGNNVTLPSLTYSVNSTTGYKGIVFVSGAASSEISLTPYDSFFVSSYSSALFPTYYPGLLGRGAPNECVVMFGNYWNSANIMGTGARFNNYSVSTYGNLTDARNIIISESYSSPSSSFTLRVGTGDGYPSNSWLGHIYEVIVFNTTLSASQRTQIEGYLAQKWNLTSYLPQGHVGKAAILYRGVKIGTTSAPLYTQFNPNSIAGCALWLDAADPNGTGVVPANGATVSTWVDKSGSNVILTTVGTPTYNSTQYGKGGVIFNGTSYFQNSTFSLPLGTRAIFIVANGSSVNTGILALANVVDYNNINSLVYTTNGSKSVYLTEYYPSGFNAVFTSLVEPVLVSDSANGSSVSYYGNGSLVQSLSFSPTASTGIFIGARNDNANDRKPLTGNINEILLYNTALTTTQCQTVESYLAQKWGLTASLPPINHINNTQPAGLPPILTLATSQRGTAPLVNTTLTGVSYYNVSQAYWGSYFYPYLQTLTKANASATTATIGTSAITGSGPGSAGYFGGVLAPNGNIYCIPCNSTSVGVINLSTNALTSPVSGTAPGSAAYYGGVLAPNGMIYCIPANATSIGMINPITNTFSLPVSGSASGGSAYFGGVLAPNGKIYCIPYYSTTFAVIDPVANTFTTFGTAPGGGAYQGGVLAPNGKIYCVPSNATSISVIDPATNTISIFGSVPLVSTGTYNGGALGPNGMIYFIPKNSPVIGMVNPTTNTYSTFGTVPSTLEIYYGGVLAPNGYIYCLSQNGGVFARIDTTTNTFATISGTVQSGGGYYGGVLAPNGIIYVIPCNATTVATITLTGLSQLPSLTYCLSPYTNKF
jgi:streptogramin lyase